MSRKSLIATAWVAVLVLGGLSLAWVSGEPLPRPAASHGPRSLAKPGDQ